MSLVSFLSCIYFIFTVVLLFKRNTMGKIYITFGLLTYIFVTLYSYIPKIPSNLQQLSIFIAFSLMIIIFGIMFGVFMKMLKKSNRASTIASIVSSFLLILVLFNIEGYLTYMYIPVLLYMLQNKVNNKLNTCNA